VYAISRTLKGFSRSLRTQKSQYIGLMWTRRLLTRTNKSVSCKNINEQQGPLTECTAPQRICRKTEEVEHYFISLRIIDIDRKFEIFWIYSN
jgi:hypothetical protein